MDGERILLDLLCAHHSLEHFDSGHAESDLLARLLLGRVCNRDADDFVAVVAAGERTHAVAGVVATTDIALVARTEDGGELRGKCLFYYLLAVDRQHSGSVLRSLLVELDAIRERRLATGDYIGEVAAPLRGTDAQASSLTRFVEGRGFRRLEEDHELWYRPVGDPPAG